MLLKNLMRRFLYSLTYDFPEPVLNLEIAINYCFLINHAKKFLENPSSILF